jgi:sugar phosphate isomerase/epimerase|tara:strand:+ start:427 stop:1248 length:822 start_codon:yes stop_codon:yes gene_type:complete
MINKIGIMQGRLVPREIKSRMQSFPFKNWKKEIYLAKKNNIRFVEWTIDYNNFLNNPIIKNPALVKKIIKNKVKVHSVTCDFFMQKPFFKIPNNKNKIFEYLKILINSCVKLGIKYVVIPLVDKSSIKSKKEEKLVITELIKFEKKNYFGKTKILFETDYDPKHVINFISKFNNKFGINYDAGNSAGLNYNINQEFEYFDKVFNVHIKDKIIHGKTVRLGKGNLNLNNLISNLKKKYKGNLILQTYIPKNKKKVLYETLKNFNYLKQAIVNAN